MDPALSLSLSLSTLALLDPRPAADPHDGLHLRWDAWAQCQCQRYAVAAQRFSCGTALSSLFHRRTAAQLLCPSFRATVSLTSERSRGYRFSGELEF